MGETFVRGEENVLKQCRDIIVSQLKCWCLASHWFSCSPPFRDPFMGPFDHRVEAELGFCAQTAAACCEFPHFGINKY